MAKEKKMARVRWDKVEQPDGTFEERYILERWNEDEGCWEAENRSWFVADADNPKGPKDFIHYTLLIDVINMVNDGYEIDI